MTMLKPSPFQTLIMMMLGIASSGLVNHCWGGMSNREST
jgi:hypothetical protein